MLPPGGVVGEEGGVPLPQRPHAVVSLVARTLPPILLRLPPLGLRSPLGYLCSFLLSI